MIRFKIFYGNHTNVSADVKLNQWIKEHPLAVIIDWQYQQVRMGDHSICIKYAQYEEEENDR